MHELLKRAMEEQRHLLEPEAMQLFKEYGLPVPAHQLAQTKETAIEAAREIGYPVVLKIVSRDILHKSDVGGVKVGLINDDEVGTAFDEIMTSIIANVPQAKFEGMLVVHQVPKGTECIVGMVKDPQFGPALMFGSGGIFVELLKDVSFRVYPFTREDAEAMIKETKAYELLKGIRGQSPKDIPSVVDFLEKVAALIEQNPQIQELDINPLVVFEEGLQAVDARIIV